MWSFRIKWKNLDLPSRWCGVRRVLRNLGGDVCLNVPFSLIDGADGIQYLGTHEALHEVSLRRLASLSVKLRDCFNPAHRFSLRA